jgi:hypothetical protein
MGSYKGLLGKHIKLNNLSNLCVGNSKRIIADYFDLNLGINVFDGVVTDIPYKGAIPGTLNENDFSFGKFFKKTDVETKDVSFLITFSNFLCCKDLINFSKNTNWKFHTVQIWNKLPTRTWVSWSYPLRHTEYIMYFKKGNFKYCFKNGKEKQAYKRSSFGGSLKNISPNTKHDISYGMFNDIVSYKQTKNKKHPTEKPLDFSRMFCAIVGVDKYVLDPFCGSANLTAYFNNSINVDIKRY